MITFELKNPIEATKRAFLEFYRDTGGWLAPSNIELKSKVTSFYSMMPMSGKSSNLFTQALVVGDAYYRIADIPTCYIDYIHVKVSVQAVSAAAQSTIIKYPWYYGYHLDSIATGGYFHLCKICFTWPNNSSHLCCKTCYDKIAKHHVYKKWLLINGEFQLPPEIINIIIANLWPYFE